MREFDNLVIREFDNAGREDDIIKFAHYQIITFTFVGFLNE